MTSVIIIDHVREMQLYIEQRERRFQEMKVCTQNFNEQRRSVGESLIRLKITLRQVTHHRGSPRKSFAVGFPFHDVICAVKNGPSKLPTGALADEKDWRATPRKTDGHLTAQLFTYVEQPKQRRQERQRGAYDRGYRKAVLISSAKTSCKFMGRHISRRWPALDELDDVEKMVRRKYSQDALDQLIFVNCYEIIALRRTMVNI